MQARQKAGSPLGLPDLGQFRHVAGLLGPDGLGWCISDGMGDRKPLPWSEIMPFATHAGLSAWERGVLRAMSVAYVEGLAIGEEPGGVAPTATAETEHVDKAALGRGILSALRMAAPGKG